MIRTTVTFPDDLHKQLLQEAMNTKKSLSEVVVEKLQNPNRLLSKAQREEKIRLAFELFNKMAKYTKGIDLVEALHNDRRTRDLRHG